jgi:hypothetical protein
MGGTYYLTDPTARLEEDLALVGGRKAVVVKEFGIVGDASFASVSALLAQLAVYSGDPALGPGALVSGALLWSLRGHARGGGFYWHYEYSIDTYTASLHWPGFVAGAAPAPSRPPARPHPPISCFKFLSWIPADLGPAAHGPAAVRRRRAVVREGALHPPQLHPAGHAGRAGPQPLSPLRAHRRGPARPTRVSPWHRRARAHRSRRRRRAPLWHPAVREARIGIGF